ncbi:alpha/beta-hydrolase [Glonium stellatum]|uniref:Alpha/beta-hydrolase n=1 Tax=Glonium stellatum TaxID=574774 RepID=A0A8E2ERH8_9PEZI|nr:alpha/beta-hydrolase [Glonium stellatum]
MTIRSSNSWETTTQSSLVSIETHSLFLSTSGPPRTPGIPVVIFFTGGGAPAAVYIRLQAVLAAFARVYFYDRAGYGQSEMSPVAHPTAEDAAEELHTLLATVNVAPPYLLVSHSYGSLIAREFLALQNRLASRAAPGASAPIAGMVLAEAATEMMHAVFAAPMPPPEFATVTAGVDFARLTHLREESRLSDEEWEEAIRATERTERGSKAEDTRGSGRPLAAKQQFRLQAMGQQPLSVIRCDMAKDYKIMYEAGVKAGNGSEEERAVVRWFIETWELFDDELRAAQLRLSGKSRYRVELEYGHDFPVRNPEVIVDEVKWVFKELGL